MTSSIIGIFISDKQGRIIDANAAFLEMLGYSATELRSGLVRWDELTPPECTELSRRICYELQSAGVSDPVEMEYIRKDGTRAVAIVGLASLDNSVGRAVGFALDMTSQIAAQQALGRSEEQFREIAENIREVFWVVSASADQVHYVSPAYQCIWGRTCESLYHEPSSWMNAIHPDDRPRAQENLDRQLAGAEFDSEYRIVQPSGSIRWIRDRAFPVRDAEGEVLRVIGVAEDITEKKLSELQLAHQATHDLLTDLPNYRLLLTTLEEAIIASDTTTAGLSVLSIDLDGFKLINDTLGRDAGDQLLKDVADRLKSIVPDACTFGRAGGDKFIIVGTGLGSPESARRLGHQILNCLRNPFNLNYGSLLVGASIGVSLFPTDGTAAESLLRKANAALYDGKRKGKGQIRFFSPRLADAVRERLELENKLREALNNSEFRLMFQPQFQAGAATPCRYEALIRWHPSGMEAIPPQQFIPVAEETGLIVPIGTWVLREACKRAAAWQDSPLAGVGVAVNMSALQFAAPDFVETVASILAETGLDPQLLELELTESVLIGDITESSRTLQRLRSLSITVALDDFGTGYSSLGYLRKLPIDAVKIDRSFLSDGESHRSPGAVLRCVIDLAHALAMRVVVEGVETQSQYQLVRELGCDEVQGFLLGHPAFSMAYPRTPVNEPARFPVSDTYPDHCSSLPSTETIASCN